MKEVNTLQTIKFIETHFHSKQDEHTWSMEGLLKQDHISVFYLLWLIASKYAKYLELPRTLSIAVIKEEKLDQVVRNRTIVQNIWSDWIPEGAVQSRDLMLSPPSRYQEHTDNRSGTQNPVDSPRTRTVLLNPNSEISDLEHNVSMKELVFDDALEDLLNDTEKKSELESVIISFVNEELSSLKGEIISVCDGFSDGSLLLLFIASLGNFFLPPCSYYYEPKTFEEKQHNLILAFQFMQEMGMDMGQISPLSFIEKEERIILRYLHLLLSTMTS